MQRISPVLSYCFTIACIAITARLCRAQGPPQVTLQAIETVEPSPAEVASPMAVAEGSRPTIASESPRPATQSGAENNSAKLLATAIQRLSGHRTIAARMRYRISLFDQHLVGDGTYRQINAGPDQLLRLELKIPVNDQVTSMQQICDGRFLWTRRHGPDLDNPTQMQTWVSRIDLHVVRKELQSRSVPPRMLTGQALAMGHGGLPRMMMELRDHFEFQTAIPGDLNDLPAILLTGKWRQESLQMFAAPSTKTDFGIDDLPQHVPQVVSIALGEKDLFPYRIEFKRHPPASPSAVVNPESPLVAMEFLEVRINAPLDPKMFDYRPGDSMITDGTQQYLSRLLDTNSRK